MNDDIAREAGEGAGRRAARWALLIIFLIAGLLHIARPDPFVLITPSWVPQPKLVIVLTGLCEIVGAIGLATRAWRRAAAAGLALYALCVFPANIKHALDGLPPDYPQLGWWYHGPRLALQPVIVWWALWAGGWRVWPAARDNAGRQT